MKFYSALPTFVVVSANLMLTATAFTGSATFFDPGLGACGRVNLASDFIAALPVDKYGTGGRCFTNAAVHYQGKTVIVTVVDKCPGCGSNDIDLSPAAFSQLADLSLGRIPVDWEFL